MGKGGAAQTGADRSASGNLRASILMTASMAGFAIEDMFLKSAARELSVGVVLILFGLGGTLTFALLAHRRGEAVLPAAFLSRVILIRALLEVTGRLGYTLAIALTPLSNASAILQATPLVVVAGAAVVFGERVGWRRWVAILIGFAGVLIILRPGGEGFRAASLFTVMGMLGFAGRDLATRAAPPVLSNMQLGITGFFMLVPSGLLVLGWSGGARLPHAGEAGLILGAMVFGITSYWALTSAMRMGQVSVVTPFRYTRLVFALIVGAVVFGELPDLAMLTGATLIIGSGLYSLLRARA